MSPIPIATHIRHPYCCSKLIVLQKKKNNLIFQDDPQVFAAGIYGEDVWTEKSENKLIELDSDEFLKNKNKTNSFIDNQNIILNQNKYFSDKSIHTVHDCQNQIEKYKIAKKHLHKQLRATKTAQNNYSKSQLLELQHFRKTFQDMIKISPLHSCDNEITSGRYLYKELERQLIENSKQIAQNNLNQDLRLQAEARCSALERKLEKTEAQYVHLTMNRFTKFPEDHTVKEVWIDDELKKEVDYFKEEHNKLVQQLIEEKMQREIDNIKSDSLLLGLKRRSQCLVTKVETLLKEEELLKQRIESLEETSAKTKNHSYFISQELKQVLYTSREKQAEENKLNDIIHSLKSEISDYEIKLSEKLSKVSDQDFKLDKKDREINKIKADLVSVNTEKKKLNDVLLTLEINIEELQKEKNIALENKKKVETNMEKLKTDHSEILEELNQKIKNLENDLIEKDLKYKSALIDLNELKQEFHDVEKNLVNAKIFEITVKDLEVELSKLKESLVSAHEIEIDLRKQLRLTIQKIESLEYDKLSELMNKTKIFLEMSRRILEVDVPIRIEMRPKPKRRLSVSSPQVSIDLNFSERRVTKIRRSISVQPRRPTLTDTKELSILKTNVPSPPQRIIFKDSPIPQIKSIPKTRLTDVQKKLLLGTEETSADLLKRKPTADELASVAIAGSEQQRQTFDKSLITQQSSFVSRSGNLHNIILTPSPDE